MRIAIPTLLATVAAGVIGGVVSSLGWAFAWGVIAAVGAVLVLGTAAVVVAMVWPQTRREPTGHTVGI
jgi:hypothetical protein